MNKEKLQILIATGIYPPEIGGPAQYAKNLKEQFELSGHKVIIKTFNIERRLPSGLRHILFFVKSFFAIWSADLVIVMDTFSVGLPTILTTKILGKKSIIRVGGDFLWEQYVERTKKPSFLKDFYQTEKKYFSLKDKTIFVLTKWLLNNASLVVFSTKWQRDIFAEAYQLPAGKTTVIENYYGSKEANEIAIQHNFVASARDIFLKNSEMLNKVFSDLKGAHPDISLFQDRLSYDEFMKVVSKCFCVINLALSEVSSNLILEAIRFNRPFICTKEIGIYDRIKDLGIFVNPLDELQVKEAILSMLDQTKYNSWKQKIVDFKFSHSWTEIAGEFLALK